MNKLQRDILRLNKISDLEVKTVIRAGEAPGTSDITLKVQDKFPWHLGLGFDNQGTRLVGKLRSSFALRGSNVSGNADSIFFNTLFSTNSFGESASYSIPLDTYGTKFNFDMTYFKMRLGKEYKSAQISGKTQIYTPRVSKELFLLEDAEGYLDVGMDIKSIIKKSFGVVTSDDQLRLPFFGFSFSKIDSFGGQTTFAPKFNFGTANFWGASSCNHPSSSRAGTGGFFFKYEFSLNRFQRMPWDSYLSMRTQFQAVSHTLPSSEQFQIGGANSVRGYPEGDYLADNGGSMNLDWVMPMYVIPKDWKLPHQETPLRHSIEPVIFVDLGGGSLKKVQSGEQKNKFLAGIGGGLRFHLYNKAYLRLDWAKSIGDAPISGSGPSTFNFTFQSEL